MAVSTCTGRTNPPGDVCGTCMVAHAVSQEAHARAYIRGWGCAYAEERCTKARTRADSFAKSIRWSTACTFGRKSAASFDTTHTSCALIMSSTSDSRVARSEELKPRFGRIGLPQTGTTLPPSQERHDGRWRRNSWNSSEVPTCNEPHLVPLFLSLGSRGNR